jgi:hypothetical protein
LVDQPLRWIIRAMRSMETRLEEQRFIIKVIVFDIVDGLVADP